MANGSFLSRAVPATSIKEIHQKVIIYGPNRVGKTSLACEWDKPLLLVDFEPQQTGGAVSISKVPGVDVLHIEPKYDAAQQRIIPISEQALAIAKELREDKRYKSVVVDSASSVQHWLLHELMGWETEKTQLSFASVSKEIYQARSENLRDVLLPFLNLQKHVIVICHEKDHNPPKDDRNKLTRGLQIESFIAPAVGGATVEWLQTQCGYICRLYVAKETRKQKSMAGFKDDKGNEVMQEFDIETGRQVRRLLCLPQSQFAAGFRSPHQGAIPDWIEGDSSKVLYDKMQRVIRGEKVT